MNVSIYMSGGILLYFSILAALWGAAMGSFLHCAAWRIARGEAFLTGRSRCPRCGHTLGVLDLVPVFSWIFLRGRCRYCRAPIPARYPLAELLFAALSAACLLRFDLTVLCLRNYVFFACLFCLSLVDLERLLIPDGCLLLPALAWAAALPWTWDGWGAAAADVLTGLGLGGAMLGLSLVMDRVLGRESLGGGDVKLFALIGLYLGPAASLFAVLFSCLLGLAFALVFRFRRGEAFPFGPAIALSAACMLLWGGGLSAWYLSLLGI